MIFSAQWVIFYLIASALTIILSAIFVKRPKRKSIKKKDVGEISLINNIQTTSKKRRK